MDSQGNRVASIMDNNDVYDAGNDDCNCSSYSDIYYLT